jgi:hypothetical protein
MYGANRNLLEIQHHWISNMARSRCEHRAALAAATCVDTCGRNGMLE